ncbi:MAG: hypothetical protein U0469_01350 [Candidatus Paceibacterota bacterium]|jgi:Na+-transporting methylmalonyl-CoA/oxaloacetate decarboxylase gamma subunit
MKIKILFLYFLLIVLSFISGLNVRASFYEEKSRKEVSALKQIKLDLSQVISDSVQKECDGYKKIDSLIAAKEKQLGIK